jgi:long-chain acyl-CoA synthetase
MDYPNLTTLHRFQADALGPRPALRAKRDGLFRDLSWTDYSSLARSGAAALVDLGIQPGDRVGLLGENRIEWLLADMAILGAGAVTVSPHAPLAAAQIEHQLVDAGVTLVFVSNREQMDKIRQSRSRLPMLRGAVVFDRDALGEDNAWWQAFLLRGWHARGRLADELRRREEAMGPETLAALLYTSGTTAAPKGVMLTHGNLISNASALAEAAPREGDALALGWLPLSHIYARTVDHYAGIVCGSTLALAESSDSVVQNLVELQPTHLSCVPRFYEKLLPAVAGPTPEITGKKLRAIFGARMQWLASGGAPLAPSVAKAYSAAGFQILQGYGLTETSPVLTFNRKNHFKLETVGQALPGVELQIAPDGEILTRGPQVMKGYWNDPETTRLAIRGGWFHTGDIGELDSEGFLTITGRKKDLMVLSSGKKVVPSHVEDPLLADPCIDQAVIFGEGRSFVAALIVPQWPNFRKALAAAGVDVSGKTEASLAHDPAARKVLQERIDAALKDVSHWEKVKDFAIVEPFSVATEEMTVSMKVRRGAVFSRHRAELEAIYNGKHDS